MSSKLAGRGQYLASKVDARKAAQMPGHPTKDTSAASVQESVGHLHPLCPLG